jgi:hypothetical protein
MGEPKMKLTDESPTEVTTKDHPSTPQFPLTSLQTETPDFSIAVTLPTGFNQTPSKTMIFPVDLSKERK